MLFLLAAILYFLGIAAGLYSWLGSCMMDMRRIEWGPTWWLLGAGAVLNVLSHFFHGIPIRF